MDISEGGHPSPCKRYLMGPESVPDIERVLLNVDPVITPISTVKHTLLEYLNAALTQRIQLKDVQATLASFSERLRMLRMNDEEISHILSFGLRSMPDDATRNTIRYLGKKREIAYGDAASDRDRALIAAGNSDISALAQTDPSVLSSAHEHLLEAACAGGATAVIELLTSSRETVSVLPVRYALVRGLVGAARVFLQRHRAAFPTLLPRRAELWQYVRDVETASMLIEEGLLPYNALIYANTPAVVVYLASKGAAPDVTDEFRTPALFQHHDPAILQALLSVGANVNQQDDRGMTALHRAVVSAKHDAIATLLQAGANPNILNCEHRTAVHTAASQLGDAHLLSLTMLLRAGADPNRSDIGGLTPLSTAAYAGNRRAVDTLVDFGATKNGAVLCAPRSHDAAYAEVAPRNGPSSRAAQSTATSSTTQIQK